MVMGSGREGFEGWLVCFVHVYFPFCNLLLLFALTNGFALVSNEYDKGRYEQISE